MYEYTSIDTKACSKKKKGPHVFAWVEQKDRVGKTKGGYVEPQFALTRGVSKGGLEEGPGTSASTRLLLQIPDKNRGESQGDNWQKGKS